MVAELVPLLGDQGLGLRDLRFEGHPPGSSLGQARADFVERDLLLEALDLELVTVAAQDLERPPEVLGFALSSSSEAIELRPATLGREDLSGGALELALEAIALDLEPVLAGSGHDQRALELSRLARPIEEARLELDARLVGAAELGPDVGPAATTEGQEPDERRSAPSSG